MHKVLGRTVAYLETNLFWEEEHFEKLKKIYFLEINFWKPRFLLNLVSIGREHLFLFTITIAAFCLGGDEGHRTLSPHKYATGGELYTYKLKLIPYNINWSMLFLFFPESKKSRKLCNI